ncbi:MAG: hypothetical protein K0R63_1542 [Rickettsiales bacterium]|jgi:hypothetical protein|nr:hypothetical protein [Rickettsiales bacterium]
MLRMLLILHFCMVVPVLWFALFPETSFWKKRPRYLRPPHAWWVFAALVIGILGLFWAIALSHIGTALPYDAFVDSD